MFVLSAALVGVMQSASPLVATVSEDGTIQVVARKLASDEGRVRMLLYRSKDGFPTKPGKAWRKASAPIENGIAKGRFKGVPAGIYALSIFHDENDNGKLDTNFLGIPKEGVGASRNAKGTMGPPKWKDASFQLEGAVAVQMIRINYL